LLRTGAVNPEELEFMRGLFEAIDSDQSGAVDYIEIDEAMRD
jgi:hypothetical protein